MGSHPINLAVRFLLEVVALLAMAYWGWTQHEGLFRFVWAIGLPVVSAVIWGSFAVPDDPSRSGAGFLRPGDVGAGGFRVAVGRRIIWGGCRGSLPAFL
jgi:hypothetical protein